MTVTWTMVEVIPSGGFVERTRANPPGPAEWFGEFERRQTLDSWTLELVKVKVKSHFEG